MTTLTQRPAVAARRLAQRLSAALGETVEADDRSIGRAARRAGWARPRNAERLEAWIEQAKREDGERWQQYATFQQVRFSAHTMALLL